MSSKCLLCKPDFFGVHYEINPWMKINRSPDISRAQLQWQKLVDSLKLAGAELNFVDPISGLPDMVFTANAGLVFKDKAVLSRFKHKERSGEEEYFEKWFLDNGFNVIKLDRDAFEGEGDALFCGETLIAGYGFRSDANAYDEISKKLELSKVIKIKLINPYFYHLDTCLCPINDSLIMLYTKAFENSAIKTLEKSFSLLDVTEEDAKRFVCNTVVLNKNLVIPAGCSDTYKKLEALGYHVYPVELDEFLKSGGAAKCLTLKIDR